MPLLGFKKQFAENVENGLDFLSGIDVRHKGAFPKITTIRAYRKDKRDPKPGEVLHLWTGLRQTGARLLGYGLCVSVRPICLQHQRAYWVGPKGGKIPIPGREVEAMAKIDGFKHRFEFFAFFRKVHGVRFFGLLISWRALTDTQLVRIMEKQAKKASRRQVASR